MSNNNPKFTLFDEDENEVSLPCHFAVCDRCNGTGVHDHPAFSNGITSEEWNEDEDFREDYMRGNYDVPCSACHGNRVVAVPDEDKLTPDQAELLRLHRQGQSEEEERAERRMRERGIEF